jgi:heat shock protein HslJ
MKKIIPAFLLIILLACSHTFSPDTSWKGKSWVLVEMKGVPVQLSGSVSRDAHLEFIPGQHKYTGTGGCNRINGNYNVIKKTRISFTDPASTNMLCSDIDFENTFLSTLRSVDNFISDEQVLLLKRGGEVVLKFKAR